MTFKNSITTLLTLAIMGLAVWLTLLVYRPTSDTPAQNKKLPDAFMEDVTALILDKEGHPKMIIVTPKLIHYTENDTTDLTTPTLTLYRQSPQPWLITSKYAKAMDGTEFVQFWDDVVIRHAADPNTPTTLIKTKTLTVYPSKETAETAELITLIQPNMTVKATGMHADMKTGDIKLMSEARGEYVPNAS